MKKSLAVVLSSLFILAMSTSLVAAAEQSANASAPVCRYATDNGGNGCGGHGRHRGHGGYCNGNGCYYDKGNNTKPDK